MKDWFEDEIWIKKFQTKEFEEEGKNLSAEDYHDIGHQRVKKIGEVEYFCDPSILFGTPLYKPQTFNSFLTSDYFLTKSDKFYKELGQEKFVYHRDKLQRIFGGASNTQNRLLINDFDGKLDVNRVEEFFFTGGLKPGLNGDQANFLVGHATLEKNTDENYHLSYYMGVSVHFMRGFDDSWEVNPYVIMVKEAQTGSEAPAISVNYFTGHPKIAFDKIRRGLKPLDSDSFGFLVAKSVEDIDSNDYEHDYPEHRK